MLRLLADMNVTGELDCELDGRKFSIRTAERQTTVDIADVATGLRLIRFGSPRHNFLKSLHRWKQTLDSMLHRVELQIRGRTVAVFGYGVGNRGWKLLGLPAINLKPAALAFGLASRPRSSVKRRGTL